MSDDYLFDDGEHVFGPTDSSECMTTEEHEALLAALKQSESRLVIDPIRISEKLHEKGILQTELYNYTRAMRAQGRLDSEILNYLLVLLPYKTNMNSIVRLLIECGYKEIAASMYCVYLKISGRSSKRIKGHSAPRTCLRELSRRFKTEIHNAPFANRGQYLREKEERIVSWLPHSRNARTRQSLADICITIIGAEIDAMAITFNAELYKNDIFRRYKAIIPETSDSTLSYIGLLGRWANACAIAGEFAEAEEKLAQARSLAIFIGPSLELFNLFYTEIYERLWHYEHYPSESLRDSILFWGKTGLKCLEDELDSYTLLAWKKNFMLRMSLCLLGLGNTTKLIEGCIIDRESIKEAGVFIQALSRPEVMESIPLRRLMLLYIVKARWLELSDCLRSSLDYYNKARHKAEGGHFEELKCIDDHIKRVTHKIEYAYHTSTTTRQYYQKVPTPDMQTSDNNHALQFQQLKEISLDERGEPSGCSQHNEVINTSRIHPVAGVSCALLDHVGLHEEHEIIVSRSTELKCINSGYTFPMNLNLTLQNDYQQNNAVLETPIENIEANESRSTELKCINSANTFPLNLTLEECYQQKDVVHRISTVDRETNVKRGKDCINSANIFPLHLTLHERSQQNDGAHVHENLNAELLTNETKSTELKCINSENISPLNLNLPLQESNQQHNDIHKALNEELPTNVTRNTELKCINSGNIFPLNLTFQERSRQNDAEHGNFNEEHETNVTGSIEMKCTSSDYKFPPNLALRECSQQNVFVHETLNEEHVHGTNVTGSTEIKCMNYENIFPLNLQCDPHTDLVQNVYETLQRTKEQDIVKDKSTEGAYCSPSSRDQYAMYNEPGNEVPVCSETDNKELFSNQDIKLEPFKSNSETEADTELKLFKSINSETEVKGFPSSETDIVRSKGIPSWEREPPSGQSSD